MENINKDYKNASQICFKIFKFRKNIERFILTDLSPSLDLERGAFSSDELEANESLLSPLLPLSLPGPHCLSQVLRLTTVGELSLEVVSGALLSILAIPKILLTLFLKSHNLKKILQCKKNH